jgi:hypothetical protein
VLTVLSERRAACCWDLMGQLLLRSLITLTAVHVQDVAVNVPG